RLFFATLMAFLTMPLPLRKEILESIVASCSKQIEYDMKHGVTVEEVIAVLKKIRHDDSYSEFRQIQEAVQRLDDLERQLISPKWVTRW
ncbi:MAG: hypothetical protein WBP84_08890, partial [Nitrososphaeraceae archaeon]